MYSYIIIARFILRLAKVVFGINMRENKVNQHILIKIGQFRALRRRACLYGISNQYKTEFNDCRLLQSGISISKKERRLKLFRFNLVTIVPRGYYVVFFLIISFCRIVIAA